VDFTCRVFLSLWTLLVPAFKLECVATGRKKRRQTNGWTLLTISTSYAAHTPSKAKTNINYLIINCGEWWFSGRFKEATHSTKGYFSLHLEFQSLAIKGLLFYRHQAVILLLSNLWINLWAELNGIVFKNTGTNVMQGLKTCRLSLPRYWARGPNRREGFSSLQFFNSAVVDLTLMLLIWNHIFRDITHFHFLQPFSRVLITLIPHKLSLHHWWISWCPGELGFWVEL